MRENVAMIDEGSDIHPSEVHKQLHLRDGYVVFASPKRDFNHVQKLAIDGGRLLGPVGLEVVLRQNLEVDLMHVEFMVLLSDVLNVPLLHRSLRRNHRRRVIVVEHQSRLSRTYLGNEKLIRLNLAKLERPRRGQGQAASAAKALLAGTQSCE